ncbi:MAG: 4Fe-4S binding protein [Lachnospiraceae bacterium]|nr:4Fe-4S binding protein [Lachnospiraceae bacterium]
MEYLDYLKILQNDIHSVVLATNDKNGHPVTAYMDVMYADEGGIYFLTSRGKEIYRRMNCNEYVSLSGMTGSDFFHSTMMTVQGKIRNIGNSRVKELFDANPYMYKIYPDEDNRGVIEVFQIYEGQGEYSDFSVQPPVRRQFTFGGRELKRSGYYIEDGCTGCGICEQKCPMRCIAKGTPYLINEENCLRCGNCYEVCPAKAVRKRGEDNE